MRRTAASMSAEAAECKQPGTSPPPSAINARGPAGDILTISAAATTGEFIVFTQFMITMAISGRHGHRPSSESFPWNSDLGCCY